MTPLVSIIITLFNKEDFVEQSVLSALGQTYPNVEVIVVDDGSTDDSLDRVRRIRDERLKIYSYPHESIERSGGPSVCKNRGFFHSAGTYVLFLDADDVLHPTKVATHVAALEARPDACLAFSYVQLIDRDGSPLSTEPQNVPESNWHEALLQQLNYLVCGSNPLHRRDTLEKIGVFDTSLQRSCDYDLYLRLSRKYQFAFVPEVLSTYQQSRAQISLNVVAAETATRRILDREFNSLPKTSANRANRRTVLRSLYFHLRTQALRNLSEGSPERFAQSIMMVLRAQLYCYRRASLSDVVLSLRYLAASFGRRSAARSPISRNLDCNVKAPGNQQAVANNRASDQTQNNLVEVHECELDVLPDNIPVSICICTRDRPQQLRVALQSLMRQKSKRPIEILVVDNSRETSETPHVVAEFPGVKLVTERRPGLSYARNTGVLACTGEIIVSVDDDTTVPDDWLECLIGPFIHPNVNAVTGNILPFELKTESQRIFESLGGLGRGEKCWQADREWLDSFKFQCAPVWLLGATANAAFRASVFKDPKVGLFDVALGAGCPTGMSEDIYLYYQIVNAGGTFVYNPGAFLWHTHRRTMSELRHQLFSYSKGFVAYQLITLLNHGDFRALSTLLFYLPFWRAQDLRNALWRRSAVPVKLVLLQIAGDLLGSWSLVESILRVRHINRGAHSKIANVTSTGSGKEPAYAAGQSKQQVGQSR